MKIEPENAMIVNITSDKRYLDLNSLYIYLKKDNVLTTFIKQIKIYNETLNGYELFTSETQVEIRKDITIQLVIILNNSVLNYDQHNKELYTDITNKLEEHKCQMKQLLSENNITIPNNNDKIKVNEYSNNFNENDSQVDIIILYANPIVHCKRNGQIYPINEDIIDFETEINLFKTVFEESHKHLKIEINIATLDNLLNAMLKKPKVVHITCHGSFMKDSNDQLIFYLNFEDKEGKLIYYSIKDFELLFSNHKPSIDICFLASCHSGYAAQIFANKIAKCVICVEPQNKILDKAAQIFEKTFYKSLLDHKTIEQSFEIAKNLVSSTIKPGCCCTHNHNESCVRMNKEFDENKCECNDSEPNVHNIICGWAKDKIQNYGFKKIEYGNKILLCCCDNPNHLHNESQKFKIVSNDNYKSLISNEILFKQIREGHIEIINSNCGLHYNMNCDGKKCLLGRHLIVYDVIRYYSESNVNRIVNLYNAAKGLFKKQLANYIGKYLFERKLFINGVYFIDLSSCQINNLRNIENALMQSINNYSDYSFEHFCNVYSQLKIMFIIIAPFIEERQIEIFETFIKHFLSKTSKVKMLLVSRNEIKSIDNMKNIYINKVTDIEIAKLCLSEIPHNRFPKKFQNKIELSKTLLIQNCQGIPGQVYLIKSLFEDHNENMDTISEKMRKIRTTPEIMMLEELKKKYEDYPEEMKDLFLLFILLQPNQLCRLDIYSLYENKLFDYVNNGYLYSKSFSLFSAFELFSINLHGLNLNDFIKIRNDDLYYDVGYIGLKLLEIYSSNIKKIINKCNDFFLFEPKSTIHFYLMELFANDLEYESKIKEEYFKNEILKTYENMKYYSLYVSHNVKTLIENTECIYYIKKQINHNNQAIITIIITLSLGIPFLLSKFGDVETTIQHANFYLEKFISFQLINEHIILLIFLYSFTNDTKMLKQLKELNQKSGLKITTQTKIEMFLLNAINTSNINESIKLFDKINNLTLSNLTRLRISFIKVSLLINYYSEYENLIETLIQTCYSLSNEINNVWYNIHIQLIKAKILITKLINVHYIENIINEIKSKIRCLNPKIERDNALNELEYFHNQIELHKAKANKNLFLFIVSTRQIHTDKDKNKLYYHNSNFRETFIEALNTIGKKVSIKFTPFNKEEIINALKNTGKVLIILSELMINNWCNIQEGESFYNLIEEIIDNNISEIKYDLLILAFPNSEVLYNKLKAKNIKYNYIITFNIPQFVVRNSYLLLNNTIMNIIENSIKQLLLDIIQPDDKIDFKTIYSYFNRYFLTEYKNMFSNLSLFLNIFPKDNYINDDNNQRLVYLHCKGKKHLIENQLIDGELQELTLKKIYEFGKEINMKIPLINNHLTFQSIINLIHKHKLINIYSNEQAMLNSMIVEIKNYFFYSQTHLNGSIYLFELSDITNMKQLEQIFTNEQFVQNEKRKHLIIIYNIENKLLQNNLFLSFLSFSHTTKLSHIIICTKQKWEMCKYSVSLKSFNKFESVIVFIYYVKRMLHKDELEIKGHKSDDCIEKSLFKLIEESPIIAKCRGQKTTIKEYALIAREKKLNTIVEEFKRNMTIESKSLKKEQNIDKEICMNKTNTNLEKLRNILQEINEENNEIIDFQSCVYMPDYISN